MKQRIRFGIVAAVGFGAGLIVATVVHHVTYRQDLEFLGIAKNMVEESLEELRGKFGD